MPLFFTLAHNRNGSNIYRTMGVASLVRKLVCRIEVTNLSLHTPEGTRFSTDKSPLCPVTVGNARLRHVGCGRGNLPPSDTHERSEGTEDDRRRGAGCRQSQA
ncbi:hypothetical protein NSPZN2_50052 [Nitrospira defluvii]|uniref:Uncharacterized protein n=1 Tax=Nitrospira defluvii TaxID=330214 RepID=A0ABN7M925_9BACT|nr:hypothetical protein NSPZN2_50052 [Nitrospira defluvii]